MAASNERFLISRNKREGFFAGWSGRFRPDGVPMWRISGGFSGSFVRIRHIGDRPPLMARHLRKIAVQEIEREIARKNWLTRRKDWVWDIGRNDG